MNDTNKRTSSEVDKLVDNIKQGVYNNTQNTNRIYKNYQIEEFKAKVKKNRTKNKIQKSSRKANRKRGK